MDTYLYKLTFKGPVHFGDTGIDLENVAEHVHSDTLFSALMNALAASEGADAASELADQFLDTPPFLLSSLFLYNGTTYFLPRPLSDYSLPPDVKALEGKRLKRLKWLDVEGFSLWISKRQLGMDDVERIEEDSGNYKKAFVSAIRPRVSLDRISQGSNIYHAGYTYFREGSGLYGLVTIKEAAMVPKFRGLLTILGEVGLGGEKTYGCGLFEIASFEKAPASFQALLEGSAQEYVLLSLYHPAADEKEGLEDRLVAYEVVRRKGWISSGRRALSLKRKSVGFLTEGSVSESPLSGTLVDVTPDDAPPGGLDHRVFRYGYAFTLPLGSAL